MLKYSISDFPGVVLKCNVQHFFINPCEKSLDFSLSFGSVVVVNTCGLSLLSALLIGYLSSANCSYLFIGFFKTNSKGGAYPGRQDIYNPMLVRVFPNKSNPPNPRLDFFFTSDIENQSSPQ